MTLEITQHHRGGYTVKLNATEQAWFKWAVDAQQWSLLRMQVDARVVSVKLLSGHVLTD